MTLTFSSQKYSDLLVKYQPKPIKTIVLIEKFEGDFYRPGSASTPHSMLLFLMEQQD